MRNDEWLKEKLDLIWQQFFPDVPRSNEVKIKFGRSARTRLGSIRKTGVRSSKFEVRPVSSFRSSDYVSLITMTGYFKDERVPEFIIDLTIAHELCHYAHGFSSPLPQLSRYPHQGGIVDKEMVKRGFAEGLQAQKRWLKDNWGTIVKNSKSKYRNPKKTQKSKSKIIKIFRSFGF